MDLIRVAQTSAVTLSHTFYVDLVATNAAAGVTVAVKRLDGTLVASGPATPGGTGVYTYPLPAQANLDTLTVDWSGSVGGGPVTVRDIVEVAGGFMFSLAEAVAMPPTLSTTKFPAAVLAAKRTVVEVEAERICGYAFVPRFTRIALSGNWTSKLALPHPYVRALRAVRVDGVVWTAEQVAAVGLADSGVMTLSPATPWGGAVWPWGVRNVIVEYEHGLDMPPLDVRDAAIVRLRYRLTMGDTNVPYRAISFTATDGGTYRLSTPSKQRTGIPDVDAAYEGATIDLGGFA